MVGMYDFCQCSALLCPWKVAELGLPFFFDYLSQSFYSANATGVCTWSFLRRVKQEGKLNGKIKRDRLDPGE